MRRSKRIGAGVSPVPKILQRLAAGNHPVVGGFVNAPEHWVYSSAVGYEKNNGLIVLTELG
ncbi:MAG: hypothetical protein V4722_24630 [Bacteroidota bacterium]